MRANVYALMTILASLSVADVHAQQPNSLPVGVATITVRLSSFAFAPDHLRLKAGVPVRLRFVNESGSGHDFSAPAFFNSGSFPGSAAPVGGDVELRGHQSAEISMIPRVPGLYRVECTHFLHSIFGMHGTIEVIP